VAGRVVLVARDDPIINANQLGYQLPGTIVQAPGFGVTVVISGRSVENYHPGLVAIQVAVELRAAGFRLSQELVLSQHNTVEIWLR